MVMLVNVVQANKRILGRGAALLLLTGMAAGCSSQVGRFNSADDVFTASTDNQRQIIRNDSQPYPGDVAPAAPAAPLHTGSVSRGSLAPVASQPYPEPAVARVQTAPVERPVIVAERPEPAQRPVAVRPRPAPAIGETKPFKPAEKEAPIATLAPREPAGWSRVGGTQITVRDGETMSNLSQRYGVPARVIGEVNGMPADGSGLKTGRKIIIPTATDGMAPAPVRVVATEPKAAQAARTASADAAPAPSKKAAAKLDADAARKPEPKTEKKPGLVAEKKPEPAGKKPVTAASGGYTVQSGDTLSKIARKTGVSTASLKSANGLKDGGLKIGQTLKLSAGGQVAAAKPVDPTTTSSTPPARQAVAETATTTTAAVYTPPKKADKVMDDAEASKDVAPDATGIGKMRWPVRGRVVSGYGKGGGKSNDGIDIAVPEGTAVKAAENGVVIYAGDGLKEFGNTVLVRHENGLVTVYGNASSLNVKRGEKVRRGQDIAVSGMSGNADSPKLHFEVRKNSAPVDPSTFLE